MPFLSIVRYLIAKTAYGVISKRGALDLLKLGNLPDEEDMTTMFINIS